MRISLASIAIALLAACGSSSSGKMPDGNPGGGDGGSGSDGAGGGPATVTVTLVNHPDTPATYSFLAAYQDGGSAWQLAPAPSGDTYTFTINSAAWGFAWTCIPTVAGGTKRVELAYFSTGEKTSLTEKVPNECTDRLGTAARLSGSVSNLPLVAQGATYVAYFADRKAIVSGGMVPGTGTFNMEVLPGTHDLLVGQVVAAGNGGGSGSVDIASAAIVRGVTVSGATTAPPVDFSTATSSTATVTIQADPAATVGAATTLYSANATNVAFAAANVAPYESDGLGTTATIAGDVYDQAISVSENGATAVVENWTTAIAAQTYVAPTALGGATASVPTSTPYPEIETTWNAYGNANGYVWDAQQGGISTSGGAMTEWSAVLGPGYIGGSPRFEMPDLSGLTGWQAGWQFATGTDIAGTVTAQTSSGGIGDFPAAPPAAAGTTRAFASSGWTVTP